VVFLAFLAAFIYLESPVCENESHVYGGAAGAIVFPSGAAFVWSDLGSIAVYATGSGVGISTYINVFYLLEDVC
jgi:hypothetical protein